MLFFQEKFHRISQSEAYKMMKNQDVAVIDVREPEEYQSGHIPGARLIPLSSLASLRCDLPKDQTLLIYCRSGHRSVQAAKQFVKMGYQNVYEFGGIMTWPYEIE